MSMNFYSCKFALFIVEKWITSFGQSWKLYWKHLNMHSAFHEHDLRLNGYSVNTSFYVKFAKDAGKSDTCGHNSNIFAP